MKEVRGEGYKFPEGREEKVEKSERVRILMSDAEEEGGGE